jgi:phage terminase small subunit
MKGRKPEIHALSGALDQPPPAPTWLPKFAKIEWARVVPALVKARSLASHELKSTVESYCLAIAAVMSVGRAAANAIACFPTIPRRSFEIPVTNAN